MRAYTHIFREGLTKGLRRFKTNPRNSQALVECYNAVPWEAGLKAYSPLKGVTISGGGGEWDTVNFPYPMIKFLEYYTLGFAYVGSDIGWFELANTSELNWSATLMKTLNIIPSQIEVAGSGSFYVLTLFNGDTIVTYKRFPDGTIEGLR